MVQAWHSRRRRANASPAWAHPGQVVSRVSQPSNRMLILVTLTSTYLKRRGCAAHLADYDSLVTCFGRSACHIVGGVPPNDGSPEEVLAALSASYLRSQPARLSSAATAGPLRSRPTLSVADVRVTSRMQVDTVTTRSGLRDPGTDPHMAEEHPGGRCREPWQGGEDAIVIVSKSRNTRQVSMYSLSKMAEPSRLVSCLLRVSGGIIAGSSPRSLLWRSMLMLECK